MDPPAASIFAFAEAEQASTEMVSFALMSPLPKL